MLAFVLYSFPLHPPKPTKNLVFLHFKNQEKFLKKISRKVNIEFFRINDIIRPKIQKDSSSSIKTIF